MMRLSGRSRHRRARDVGLRQPCLPKQIQGPGPTALSFFKYQSTCEGFHALRFCEAHLIEQHHISFDLLSDPGNAYAAKLGLRFMLPDDLKEVYLSFGNDLALRNGEESWTLPMPGRFVIDTQSVVRAADVDPDYQNRPEPQKTVDDVKALS